MPGAEGDWEIVIEVDWIKKEVNVTVPNSPTHISSWQGLAVQTYGDHEIAFRTRGIPPRLTHWWHFVRDIDDLWGIIIAVPETEIEWTTCTVALKKVPS